MTNNSRTSSTVATALRLLKLLAEHPEGLGVSGVARRLDIGRSTAHLLLATLHEQEFAARNDERRYSLGFAAFEVGSALPEAARFRGELLGPMQELADVSGEAVSLAVLHDRDAVIVQRFETRHVLRAEIGIGTRMPLTTCASGKVLLAAMPETEVDALFPSEDLPGTTSSSIRSRSELKERVLPAVRQQGYAVTDGEYAEGITGLGAGVFDGAGRVVAALSVAGPSSRFDTDKWLQPLIEAANGMSALLAARANSSRRHSS